jgi:thiamine-phosphate pyrophosphorylase
MENNKALNGLYPITPSIYKSDIDYLYHIKIVVESGVNIIQFRSKNLSFRRKAYLIKSISLLCIMNDVKLIINDDPYMAKMFDVSGLHIGSKDMDLRSARRYFGKNFIIGKSCYDSIELAKYSMDNDASYVSFGSMYPTSSKESAKLIKHSILTEAKKVIKIPICVIGGINKSNMSSLLKYKPDMISMISGVFDNKEIKREIEDIKSIIL